MRLSLNLLGGFHARLEPGAPLAFQTRKAQALLAYLALPPGQAHARDKLAALLWGDHAAEQARSSLRQALYEIRKTLGPSGPAVVRADGEHVWLDPAAADHRVLVGRAWESDRILLFGPLTHEHIRDVAYAALPPWRARPLHRRVAEAIEILNAERLPDCWEALADHLQRAGAWAEAAGHYLRVAERAKQRHAYATAEQACRQAVRAAARAPGAVADHARALARLGDVLSFMGDLEGANESYLAALGVAPGDAERRRIANELHHARDVCRDGARIAFYEHGSGDETLLLMNPIVYGLEIFQPMLERLCQDFRIVTIDPRGAGRSDPIHAGYRTADHAADVQAVITALGGGPVTAIAISRSASILVKVAVSAPGLVRRLVLVGAPLDIWPGIAAPPLNELDAQFREAFRAGDVERALRLFVATVVTDPDTEELAEQFTRNLLRLPREAVLSTWAPDPDGDIARVLHRVTAPTLVTHGTLDQRVPLSAAHHLVEHLPDAQLSLFEGRGHLPIFTATAEFCEVLRRFVSTGRVGAPAPESGAGATATGPRRR